MRDDRSFRLAYQRQRKSLEDKEGPYSAPHEREIQEALGWKGAKSELHARQSNVAEVSQ